MTNQTLERHASIVRRLESDLAFSAEALALKSNLLPSDLPKLPFHVMPHFHPPLMHRPGFPRHEYDLGVGPPPPKTHAIELLRTVVDFAVLLHPYATDVHREAGIIWRAVLAAERPGARRRTPSSEAVAAVVAKWADERAREEELDKWVADAAMVVSRVQEEVAGRDTLVRDVPAARWIGGAYASGVRGPDWGVRRRDVQLRGRGRARDVRS